MFHHNLNAILSLMIGVRPDRSSALYNAVLDVCVITDIYIIQNDGVFYVTIASNIGFFEDHGIFNRAVHNTAAGYQAVFDLRAHVIFGRRQIVHLGVNIRVLLKEISLICGFRKSMLVLK